MDQTTQETEPSNEGVGSQRRPSCHDCWGGDRVGRRETQSAATPTQTPAEARRADRDEIVLPLLRRASRLRGKVLGTLQLAGEQLPDTQRVQVQHYRPCRFALPRWRRPAGTQRATWNGVPAQNVQHDPVDDREQHVRCGGISSRVHRRVRIAVRVIAPSLAVVTGHGNNCDVAADVNVCDISDLHDRSRLHLPSGRVCDGHR